MPITRAVLYSRVSTDRQEREGVSLETQLELARQHCEVKGWVLGEVYTDVMSGRSDKRPQLKRMEQDAQARRFEVVIVYKLDRLARSTGSFYRIVGGLQQAGASLVSLTEDIDLTTTTGKALTGLLAIFAEVFSDQLSERVRAGHRTVAAKGQWLGGVNVPYGYAYPTGNKSLVINEDEAPMVREAFASYLRLKSLGTVADHLRVMGYRGRGGGLVQLDQLGKMLSNPVYLGHIAYGKTGKRQGGGRIKRDPSDWIMCEGAHEALVDQDTFDQVQAIMAQNRLNGPRVTYGQVRYPWSGLIRCAGDRPDGSGPCGARLIVRQRKFKTKGGPWVSLTYECAHYAQISKAACPDYARLSEQFLDRVVVRRLSEELERCSKRKPSIDKPAPRKPKVDGRLKRIEALQAKRERELDLFRGGFVSYEKLTANIKEIDRQIAALAVEEPEQEVAAMLPELPGALAALWPMMTSQAKGELLRSLIERGEAGGKVLTLYLRPFAAPGWPESLTFQIVHPRGIAPL
jgi:site-specific DNA recombinase